MITRIEIDGFKSFLDFKLDVPPFLALIGPNSSGKSNLLDAIEYQEELFHGEGLLQGRRGRPHEQFHMVSEGDPVDRLTVVVHWLVRTPDGFVALAAEKAVELDEGTPRFATNDRHYGFLGEESPLPPEVRERRWKELSTLLSDDSPAEAWVPAVDAIAGAFPPVREYVPYPQAMRGIASRADQRPLLRHGGNLAAVLGRISGTEAFADLMVDVVALLPDVTGLKTELDEKRQEWSFDLVIEGQGSVPSSLLSDGTLRILGLLAALHDPDHAGVLMIEEIENGLHPGLLAELLRRIQTRVTDLHDPDSLDRPLRQVIVTSHSPVVVSELYRTRPGALVFMDSAVRVDPDNGRVSRVSVAKPVRDEGEPGTYVSPRQVRKYLGTVRQDDP
ncbi:AAA family ATPase [Actinomadura terrae]|uniref:AAA family ATPase n=1 Tax=Actinomadura terrae TaxID=604353 RepID=UPI001FA7EDBF|nr:ATP-binding protein [Actinomadura terrae]